jgi:hypothetical protein
LAGGASSGCAILRAAQAYQALRLIFLQLRQRLAIASPLRFGKPNHDTTQNYLDVIVGFSPLEPWRWKPR